MSRWADVQNGRVDLVADDRNADTGLGWELYRVLIGAPDEYSELDDIDRAFVVRRVSRAGQVKMSLHMDIADAVKCCMEWMG